MAVSFGRAAAFLALGAALVGLAAALLLFPAVRAMGDAGGSSGGMGCDLPMVGHGGTLPRVHGEQTLDVEEYILEDIRFMEEHSRNIEVHFSVRWINFSSSLFSQQ